MRVIYAKNIDDFISEKLSHYKEVVILGKGPTFQPISKPYQNTLVVAINDTINYSDHIDMFAANDIEFYDKIDCRKIQTIKYVLIPNRPHVSRYPCPNTDYNKAIEILGKNFKGDVIVYNLKTSTRIDIPYDEKYITLDTACSTGHSVADFIGGYLNNIELVKFFGIANGCGYSDLFKGQPTEEIYNEEKIVTFKSIYLKSLKGIKSEFN